MEFAKGPSHNTFVWRPKGPASVAEIPARPINFVTYINLRALIGTRGSWSAFARRPAASRITLAIALVTVG